MSMDSSFDRLAERSLPVPPGRYFFVIGAMKAGTSSLYKYLASHPSIYAAPRKEPRFFSNPKPTAADMTAYASLFAGRTCEAWAFEASTAYTKYPMVSGVPERIQASFPDARLIYLMRDPVERICSAYLHNVAEGRERRSLEEAVFDRSRAYLSVSRYHLQLSQYLRVFPRERILALVFEELVADIDATLEQIATFLNLEPGFTQMRNARRYNETARKRAPLPILRALKPMLNVPTVPARVRVWAADRMTRPLPARDEVLDVGLRARIGRELEEDLSQLRDLLGRNFSCWRRLPE